MADQKVLDSTNFSNKVFQTLRDDSEESKRDIDPEDEKHS